MAEELRVIDPNFGETIELFSKRLQNYKGSNAVGIFNNVIIPVNMEEDYLEYYNKKMNEKLIQMKIILKPTTK